MKHSEEVIHVRVYKLVAKPDLLCRIFHELQGRIDNSPDTCLCRKTILRRIFDAFNVQQGRQCFIIELLISLHLFRCRRTEVDTEDFRAKGA